MNFLKEIQDRLRKFSALRQRQREQMGEGVTTRRQAKLAQTSEPVKNEQLEPESEPMEADEPDVGPMEADEPDVGPQSSSLSVTESEMQPELEKEEPSANITEPTHSLFNEETLIAQNESLEAYAVKVFFKRQKRFQ